jgi:hypothetical protein
MVILMMIVQRFVHVVSSMVVVIVLLIVSGWSSLLRIAISQNLEEYAKSVRAGSCSLEEKLQILNLINLLEKRMDDGANISTFRWFRHDRAICPLLEGDVTSDRAQLIERELLKVRDELAIEKERTTNP